MSQWTMNTPPTWAPHAVATSAGWADPKTGEVLVAIKDLDKKTVKKAAIAPAPAPVVQETPKATPKKTAVKAEEPAPAPVVETEQKPAE